MLYRIAFLLLAACGPRGVVGRVDDQPYQAYSEQRATSISDGTVSVTATDGNGCIEVVNGTCVKPTRTGAFCEGGSGPVDVVTVDGKAVETICYPSPGDGKNPVVVTSVSQTLDVAKTANGTAITFDHSTDGVPITGPVTLSANNVSLYGNGPDKTIIDGDLVIEKNNAHVRGVRIKGNLVVKFNNTAVALSQIDGNVTSDKNSCLFASNKVGGDFTVAGNNVELYYNEITGTVSAAGATCDKNTDENGAALTCK